MPYFAGAAQLRNFTTFNENLDQKISVLSTWLAVLLRERWQEAEESGEFQREDPKMFNLFRKPAPSEEGKTVNVEISATRAAELLGTSVPKFHEAIKRGLISRPLHSEQPPSAWTWPSAEIFELAQQHPRGYVLPPVPWQPPVARVPETVRLVKAAELLRMHTMDLSALALDPKAPADMPRFLRNNDRVGDRFFLSRLYRWAEQHRPAALPDLDDYMRRNHLAFDPVDGQIYGAQQ